MECLIQRPTAVNNHLNKGICAVPFFDTPRLCQRCLWQHRKSKISEFND